MKSIKLSRDEELALRELIRLASKYLDMRDGQEHLDSIQIKIERAPDDNIYYMDLIDTKTREKYEPNYENRQNSIPK